MPDYIQIENWTLIWIVELANSSAYVVMHFDLAHKAKSFYFLIY